MHPERTETSINRNLSKFIFKNANFPILLLFKNVINKGSLSGSQKSSDDCDGGKSFFIRCHGYFLVFFGRVVLSGGCLLQKLREYNESR